MSWIMEIGIENWVLDLVGVCGLLVVFAWWIWNRWQPVARPMDRPLNNRMRRQAKQFYAKGRNRNKGLVLNEEAGKVVKDFSPKDYGMYVKRRANRKGK